METSSTPYDIAAIPPSPFAPSPLAWALLFGIVAIILLVASLFGGIRKKRVRAPQLHLIKKLQELKLRLTQENTREIASEVVRALKLYDRYHRRESPERPALIQTEAFKELDMMRFSPVVQETVVKVFVEKLEEVLAQGEKP